MSSEFIPKPGQVDYSNERWAPVINCIVKYGDKILIVERSKDLNFYPRYWNGVSGFLDDDRSLEQKVKNELREELGVSEDKVLSIKLGEIFHQEEPQYEKTWIVHPVLVEVNTDQVKLDWEAENYRWINVEEVKNFKLLPGFDRVIGTFFR